MSRFYSMILILLFPLITFADCEPNADSCEFYQCKEQEQSCGPSGYWQDFGYPYCRKFLDNKAEFSENSQVWLREVRGCLQQRIGAMSNQTTCSSITKDALDSHVGCYVDTGFCELDFDEQFKIYWYLKGALRNVYTWYEASLLNIACARRDDIDN